MRDLEDIRRALAGFRPRQIQGERQAGVAMLLCEPASGVSPEVLFIERARREGDPWSGHMAFPGGKRDPGDTSVRHAAERETLEEVGISLESAELLGPLGDLQGRGGGPDGLVISGWVYRLPSRAEPIPNYEVATSFWFPLWDLLDVPRQVEHTFPKAGKLRFPGVVVGEPDRHVVWGLTHRFLQIFFDALGAGFPPEGSPLASSGSSGAASRRS